MKQSFVFYDKMSKKERRKVDLSKRRTWGDMNPTTRTESNPRAYNRAKAKRESRCFCG